MSDPNTPQDPSGATPPPAPQQPAGATPPPPAYNQAPPPAAPYGSAPAGPVPGRTLGIVAFVLSFFTGLIALILGIVALVQSKKAGASNGWAVAAIVISSIAVIIGIIVIVIVVLGAVALGATCADLGPGTHALEGGGTITCG